MCRDSSLDAVMVRLRRGDDAAAAQVFDRFAQRLIALARSRLPARIDPEDVTQSVYRSFFARQAAGQFDVHGWDDLWRLLAEITVRKCSNKIRHDYSGRRNVRREVAPAATADDSASAWEIISGEPTASHAAMLTETIEALMRGFDQHERDILTLSLQGYTALEISAELGRAERTVQRVRQRVRKRLERMRAEDVD